VDDDDPIGALEAWLLTEEAYPRGGVPDEVLTFMQDHIDRVLGPRATQVAGDFLRERLEAGDALARLARDRALLADLLALIEGKRRPGFEMQWRVLPPTPPADGDYRPEALLVMAEHNVGDPVWDRPQGTGSPVTLSGLGVSDSLQQRLRAWNEVFERSALEIDDWDDPAADSAWVDEGLTLAHELQRELPDVDVRYFHADDDRPLRVLAR
jgi:hypothetical protein